METYSSEAQLRMTNPHRSKCPTALLVAVLLGGTALALGPAPSASAGQLTNEDIKQSSNELQQYGNRSNGDSSSRRSRGGDHTLTTAPAAEVDNSREKACQNTDNKPPFCKGEAVPFEFSPGIGLGVLGLFFGGAQLRRHWKRRQSG